MFKVGDVVMLKSGGPEMTVKAVIEKDQWNDPRCDCVWQRPEPYANEIASASFLPDTLIAVPPKHFKSAAP